MHIPKIFVRLTRSLYDEVRRDLARPHNFALERVGFMTVRLGNTGHEPLLVLADSYTPVADEHYVNDSNVGARINSAAIRTAMQQAIDRDCGIFHVHEHPFIGKPRLSRVDSAELPQVVAGTRNATPSHPHGLLLLSEDSGTAFVLLPDSDCLFQVERLSVVGFPTEIFQ